VIVGLAMAAAVSLGAGLVMLSEAGVSATLVATLQATTAGFPPARLLDVLLGGAIALVFSQLLFPVHPVKLVRSAAEAMVRELADTLRAIADALERRDRDQAEEVLSVPGGSRRPGDGSSRRSTPAERRRALRRCAAVSAVP
jgi:uncharacterized membrane protein YgaE (UPF0421/DUF939 family)